MNNSFYNFSLKYASRSLSRNFRRSTLTVLTLAFCLSISIIASRYAISVMALWKDGASDTGTAHFQYVASGYSSKPEGIEEAYTLKDGNEFETYLLNDTDVEAISKRMKFEGLIKTDSHSFYFLGIAVDPNSERRVSPRLFMDGLDIGKFVDPNNINSATIGQGLAELMSLDLGSEASIVSQTFQGSVNAVDLVIDGYVNIPIPSFSNRVVYLNLENARKLIRTNDRYTEIAIRLKPGVNQNSWYKKALTEVKKVGGELRGWWDIDPLIGKIDKIWIRIASILCALLFFSAIMTVLNAIFMIINERIIEIGTLKALGSTNKKIKILISTEAALIGLIGGAIGIIIGNIVVYLMGYFGVPFHSPFGGADQIARPSVDIYSSIWALIAVIIACFLISLIPAKKTDKLQPVEAFRNNT